MQLSSRLILEQSRLRDQQWVLLLLHSGQGLRKHFPGPFSIRLPQCRRPFKNSTHISIHLPRGPSLVQCRPAAGRGKSGRRSKLSSNVKTCARTPRKLSRPAAVSCCAHGSSPTADGPPSLQASNQRGKEVRDMGVEHSGTAKLLNCHILPPWSAWPAWHRCG